MAAWWLMLAFLATAALAAPSRNCDLREPIDLGRTISVNTIAVLKPYQPSNITEGIYGGNKFRINDFCIGEHAGTHMDAPYHFNPEGWTVAQIPLDRLLANGVFLDVSAETAGDPFFRLEPKHIDQWMERNGPFPDNAVLLISYGWAQLYADRSRYLGTTPDKFNDFFTYHFPGMSASTACKIAEIPQIVGIGVDTPSIDPSGSGAAHTILSVKNIYNLEHVNLDQPCLPARGFKVHTLPLKLDKGTGAPARIIALPDYHFHQGRQ